MNVKFGKIKVVGKKNDYGAGGETREVEILVQNANGCNFVSTSVVSDTFMGSELKAPYDVKTYRGINPENEDSLMVLLEHFTRFGVVSYTWLEPLTEVPSQGGGSGLTIEEVYPVGIEITTTDTTFNPMKVWGGTWTVSLAGAKRVWTRTA